jgi:hypothetical protein
MTLDEHKAAFIKSMIADMQKLDPGKSFRQCWDILQRQRPDLFQESADEPGELRQPHLPNPNLVPAGPISSAAVLRAKHGTHLPQKVYGSSEDFIELLAEDARMLESIVRYVT